MSFEHGAAVHVELFQFDLEHSVDQRLTLSTNKRMIVDSVYQQHARTHADAP